MRAIRSLVGGRIVIAVVKANAYGHGTIEVSRVALGAGADWLATYTPADAVALRAAGIAAPVLVLGPFAPDQAGAYSRLGLTATVGDRVAAEVLAAASDGPVAVHVHIDTGLHREGVTPEEAPALLRFVHEARTLRLQGAFTHFARSDEPEAATTSEQLARFVEVVRRVEADGIAIPITHAANSGAILGHPTTYLDAVRCGISLYGYAPDPGYPPPVALSPALSLRSRVIRTHEIEAGIGVGYGHAFRAARPARIALVPVGYADGLHRRVGEGHGRVLVAGHSATIVGRVSMDQITIDVSDIPDVAPGEEVVILGRSGERTQDAHAVAAQADTICYEVLTSITPRLPRIYRRDGQVVDAG